MAGDSESNLEMRCSVDEAWYDGTLLFAADSRDEIVVHFNNFGEEEDEKLPTSWLLDPKNFKTRVRVRSEQLQDVQCQLVNEGKLICGCLDDGEDRRYYDARVMSIVKEKHVFSNECEECTCGFRLLWLEGPMKGKQSTVGCAEVCFLSTDTPEDDPMVKTLMKILAENGRQSRKTPAVSRPRTPSPSLELGPSKKQASKTLSLLSPELPPSKKKSSPPMLESSVSTKKQRIGQQVSAKSVGSKKKRIMQANALEQLPLSSDDDTLKNLEIDARPTSRERSDDAQGDNGDGSDVSEQRGGESSKKRFVPTEIKRFVQKKSSKVAELPAPVVVVSEKKTAGRANDEPMTFKERLKLNKRKAANVNCAARGDVGVGREKGDSQRLLKKHVTSSTKKMAAQDIAFPRNESAPVEEANNVIRPPISLQVKFSTSGKQKVPQDVAATCPEAAPVRADDDSPRSSIKGQEKSKAPRTAAVCKAAISLTVGESVKLKKMEKSKSGEASSPQKKLEVNSKQKKPETTPWKTKPAAHKDSLQKVGMHMVGKQKSLKQCQLASLLSSKPDEETRPVNPSRRPTDITAKEMSKEQHKRKPIDITAEEMSKELQKRKRGRPRKNPLPKRVQKSLSSSKNLPVVQSQNSQQQEEITVSDKSAQEEEEALHEPHCITKQPLLKKARVTTTPQHREQQQQRQSPQIDIKSFTKPLSNEETPHVDSTMDSLPRKPVAESYHEIQKKFRQHPLPLRESSVEEISEEHDAMTPGSSEELTGSPPRPLLQIPTDVAGSSRRRRRRVVISDGEEEDDEEDARKKFRNAVESAANGHGHGHGGDGIDVKTTSTSELEQEVVVQKDRSRLLLISNMEMDVSAHDAMKVLQDHTDGVDAVHVLPVGEFQCFAVGYALYRDCDFARKAVSHLQASDRFIVSQNGRPWIISQSTHIYGPHFCGFAAHTAFKSDNPGVCGIISDQPSTQKLLVVTKQGDSQAYSQALQKSKTYAEHQKWRKELFDKIVKDEMSM